MKAILLNTPAVDNSGARRDAGEKVSIGEAAGEILPDVAQALVAASSATDVSPATKKAD